MVFSNLIFLYLFLPVCLIAYFFCPGIRAKNAVLILFSLIFYAWGEPVYLLLMIASAAVNWGFGLLIERRRKKLFLILALVLDLGCLAVFKYAGFFVENLNAVFGASIPVPQIALPIGISFYTFQALSYTVDVWRGDVPAQRSFAKLLLYISLFPQLIAGPIVRYSDVAAQIDDRQFDASEAFYGATRFCVGLAKKVLLADAAGKVASQILDGSLASNTTVAAWLGILLYTFEIYFDFSGYSDMAIGMGRIFGFKYMENFRLPYTAVSITDFWRRWHISLSSFFRDYVYIPLGGKKKHRLLNMAIVWALTGMWHGASWNFVLWGLYYFVLLMLDRLFWQKLLDKLPKAVSAILSHITLPLAVLFGWVLFKFTSLPLAAAVVRGMFCGNGNAFTSFTVTAEIKSHMYLLIFCAAAATPVFSYLAKRWERAGEGSALAQKSYSVAAYGVAPVLLLLLSTACLVGNSFNPFLYFRF